MMRRMLLAIALLATTGGVGAYFVASPPVTPAQQAASAFQQQRLLPLEGGQNFRDLGGYRTSDGRQIRWGLLFRSGSMHDLTPKDFVYLHRRGIKTVCDLRDTEERAKESVPWPGRSVPKILVSDYRIEDRGLGLQGSVQPRTAHEAREIMRAQYEKILPNFRAQYRQMFEELLAGRAPLAFNCSAGKDRTGVAAALVLTALGVPRETVMEDYLLSNRYLNKDRALQAAKDEDGNWKEEAVELKTMPQDVLQVFMSVDPIFLKTIFQAIDAHQGGVEGYLRDEMGLGKAELDKLRAMYTA